MSTFDDIPDEILCMILPASASALLTCRRWYAIVHPEIVEKLTTFLMYGIITGPYADVLQKKQTQRSTKYVHKLYDILGHHELCSECKCIIDTQIIKIKIKGSADGKCHCSNIYSDIYDVDCDCASFNHSWGNTSFSITYRDDQIMYNLRNGSGDDDCGWYCDYNVQIIDDITTSLKSNDQLALCADALCVLFLEIFQDAGIVIQSVD